MSARLEAKKVLLTQCTDYMGPAINELFTAEGASVNAIPGSVPCDESFDDYVKGLDDLDVVIANLAHDPCNMPVSDIRDEDWLGMFNVMVHPLMKLVRHFGTLMANRGGGKIVAVTSAAPLRGIPGSTSYCAARGSQNAFIKAAGLELAAANVNVNAVAQNYVSNPAYFPENLVKSERFQKHLQRNVPIGRVARPDESAELALFLASDKSDFIVGQVVPFSGGWATNV
ncbi:MAG TPA: SDR family oxidoreductase [Pseudomonadales bacterium]|jgi:2-keto-3-deoxy-L-fuconate dehydrogenase|nr:short-chain dehydrogenase [Gammaproteobacteria bacterium]MDP6026895.1 SDR family oxidoreductase [Pseudomonadales bacterium]MDP6316398.1 SDR family oxidoreductase [Pseudomonadales bacterium]MDP7314988.1 SDR family oxidoreductase [Pseudomonadales bacterium]MDP7577143.1 SDR family oxidoreductase [Pseudomonadales bacterium]|tara:strand:- start:22533 stop:23216 length:684 start_codon:yes stop_codon:yes gene_type:complete